MRRVPVTPHPPSYIVQDSVLPIPEPCPVIFWGVITPEQPYLRHHMAFPSGRTWVTKFDPSHVYWPSQEDPYFEWFLSSFPNYSTFLHRYPNEDWLSHNNRLHDQYRLMYPKFREEATKMRKSLLDRGIPPMEVEFHMGNLFILCVLFGRLLFFTRCEIPPLFLSTLDRRSFGQVRHTLVLAGFSSQCGQYGRISG
jgi:hypothetical protein